MSYWHFTVAAFNSTLSTSPSMFRTLTVKEGAYYPGSPRGVFTRTTGRPKGEVFTIAGCLNNLRYGNRSQKVKFGLSSPHQSPRQQRHAFVTIATANVFRPHVVEQTVSINHGDSIRRENALRHCAVQHKVTGSILGRASCFTFNDGGRISHRVVKQMTRGRRRELPHVGSCKPISPRAV